MEIFCVKCKRKTQTDDITTMITKNNRHEYTGKCVMCNTKKFKFIRDSQKKERRR